MNVAIIAVLTVINYILLAIYSYTQIDLNLTLSSNRLYQSIQEWLIFLGYFNRPLSALFYLILVLALFTLFFLILQGRFINIKRTPFLRLIIIISIVMGCISYPAFSHDIYNYIFDAKIVTNYHLSPYMYKANDFPKDDWVRFMHWTHRYYPYGPVWLFVTLPFSVIGASKFVLTLLSFKLMFALFHIGNIYLIKKIAAEIDPATADLSVVFYALNPLIIIESLISPHNEVMVLFFLLAFIYCFYIEKKSFKGILLLILSAAVKFTTIPVFLVPVLQRFLKISKLKNIIQIIMLILLLVLLPLSYYRESYSWYLIPLIGVGSILVKNRVLRVIGFLISLSSLLRYLPFLYFGTYDKAVYFYQDLFFYLPPIIGALYLALDRGYSIKKK